MNSPLYWDYASLLLFVVVVVDGFWFGWYVDVYGDGLSSGILVNDSISTNLTYINWRVVVSLRNTSRRCFTYVIKCVNGLGWFYLIIQSSMFLNIDVFRLCISEILSTPSLLFTGDGGLEFFLSFVMLLFASLWSKSSMNGFEGMRIWSVLPVIKSMFCWNFSKLSFLVSFLSRFRNTA